MSEATVPKKKGLTFAGMKAKVTVTKPGELRGQPAAITSEKTAAAITAEAAAPKPPAPPSAPALKPGSRLIFGKAAPTAPPGPAPLKATAKPPPASVAPPPPPPVLKSKPKEQKPVEQKPQEQKPQEQKPEEQKPKKVVRIRSDPNIRVISPRPEKVEAEKGNPYLLKVKEFFDSFKEQQEVEYYEDIDLSVLESEEPNNDGLYFSAFPEDIEMTEELEAGQEELNGQFTVFQFLDSGFTVDKSDEEKVDEERQALYGMFYDIELKELGVGDEDEDEDEEEEESTSSAVTPNLDKVLEDETLSESAATILETEGRYPEQTQDEKLEGKYKVSAPEEGYTPSNRRSFADFILETYRTFELPKLDKKPDPNACKTVLESERAEMYLYQQFVKEYMSWQTPYRGILVYHGLGSGKTCTSIAAAEALFATANSNRKIIVMTPFSLRQNFIGEITTCGFQHFRLKNHWVKHSLSDPTVKLFAKTVMQIPSSYLERVDHIWIPDFSQPQNYQPKPNATPEERAAFLTPAQQTEVREQINQILVYDPKKRYNGRIKFINYNGITGKDLLKLACLEPDAFDNAIIIVDEIHNLVRVMQGTIEPYIVELEKAKLKRKLEFEPIGWEKWKPKLCPADWKEFEASKEKRKAYKRGYLFYRLFLQAQNSKIIGLSGTPLINFPEELGILANLLHGYINIVEGNVVKADVKQGGSDAKDKANVEELKRILNESPFTDFQDVKLTNTSIQFRATFLPDHFHKVPGQVGVVRLGPEDPVLTFAERLASLESAIKAKGMKLLPVAKQEIALKVRTVPLLPPVGNEFRETFLNEVDGVTIENELVLAKRLTGLISYYKGSREDLMPKIRKDETVEVPMSPYQQIQYSKARLEEIDIEEAKEKKKKEEATVETGGRLAALFAEVYDIKHIPQSSNYRMASRQACNFVFPADVNRPRPGSKEEEKQELGKDKQDIVDVDAAEGADLGTSREEQNAAVAAVQAEEEEDEEEEDQSGALVTAGGGEAKEEEDLTPEQKKCRRVKAPGETYPQQIARAKDCLATLAREKLKIGTTGLEETSPKFQKILENIEAAPGASLVYSQFLEMEGIGIFSLAMNANGYEPIEIKYAVSTNTVYFSPQTIESLKKGPSVKQFRYIKFTGAEEEAVRKYSLLLFNSRFSELPKELSKVLADAGWTNNDLGSLCRVFCITSAGAEGLSLKNVRAVHIMEPYWNDVRTAQVKGRAVRICSHAELPPEERTVDIFTYVTVFSAKSQLAKTGEEGVRIAERIVNRDSLTAEEARRVNLPVPPGALQYTLTSDQRLWLISNRKKALINNLEKVMKSAAVDCRLNAQENKETDPDKKFTCLVVAGKVGDFLYDPDLKEDIELTRRLMPTKTAPAVAPPAPTVAKAVTAAATPAAPAATKPPERKYFKGPYQGTSYLFLQEMDPTSKVVTFGLYAESDTEFTRKLGQGDAMPSKKIPGELVPKPSTIKLF